MGKTFKKVNVSLAGEFGAQEEKIKQWVEANGGRFSKKVDSDVTHLLATKVAFSKGVPAVRAARRIKGIKIVSVEWLEDSLFSKSRRPKREGEYLLARQAKAAKKKAIRKRDAKREPGNGVPLKTKKPKKATDTELADHHVYRDQAGVRYSAFLIRPTVVARLKEKHMLKLYESDSIPHTYAVFVKYTKPGRAAFDYIAPSGSTFPVAQAAFNKFFKAKSGKEWNKRDIQLGPKRSKEGAELPSDEGWFQYQAEESAGVVVKVKSGGVDNGDKDDDSAAIANTTAMLRDAIQQLEQPSHDENAINQNAYDAAATAA